MMDKMRNKPDRRDTVVKGAVAGAALGVLVGKKIQDFARVERPDSLINWEQARRIATDMNKGNTLTAAERQELNRYYGALVERCIPLVSEYTGTTLPVDEERTFAFDRIDWINANLDGFRHMFAPIEDLDVRSKKTNMLAKTYNAANQTVMSYEVGLLLGYMARRVLGQYDLALLGREQITDVGKLYYVEPNIRTIEKKLGVPKDEFRLWLALHECTHAFEFEAHPWVRMHFNGLLDRYMQLMKQDTQLLQQGWRGLQHLGKRVLDSRNDDGPKPESWMEAVMDAEQRALFTEMQALMSVIEGYSNHVMDAVGRDLMPNFDEISRKFEERSKNRSQADQLFSKLTGMDVKMEQYRQGEEFIDSVVAERDHAFAHQVWDKPENLPTMQELRNPQAWIARIEGNAAVLPSGVPE